MLAEYLTLSQWRQAMPGVRAGNVSAAPIPEGNAHPALQTGRFEVFFCRGGCLELTGREGTTTVENQDILVLRNCRDLQSIRITAPLQGILVEVDSRKVSDSMETLLLDWDFSPDRVKTYMESRGGCQRIHGTPWSQNLFAALETMEHQKQEMYCVLKTAELVYLFCSCPVLRTEGTPGGYISRAVEDVRSYMQMHLDEKLTISLLSRRFHISPTALKSGFRQMYGLPIHRWLQRCRMESAARLLRESTLTVLQVAQSVGYEGLSQFSIIFRRQYGMTPVQYKKMSDSIDF